MINKLKQHLMNSYNYVSVQETTEGFTRLEYDYSVPEEGSNANYHIVINNATEEPTGALLSNYNYKYIEQFIDLSKLFPIQLTSGMLYTYIPEGK